MAQYSRKLSKGILWFYKFNHKNTMYRSECIYLSKKAARDAEHDKYAEVLHIEQNGSEKPILSLKQAIKERLDYLLVQKSEDYYKDNKRYCSWLLKKLGNVPLASVTRNDITNFLFAKAREAQAAGKDNYAVNYMRNIFSSLFNYAIKGHELMIRNPVESITHFSVRKKLKYIPSDEEIEAVRALCNDEQKLLLDFVADTAARINEPFKVTGQDIFSDYVVLYTKKSRNSNVVPRKVPKPSCIQGIQIGNTDKLFSQWSEKPKFLKRKVQQLKQRNWGWHNLRHRRASLWSKQGLPLYEIMMKLGHSNLSTTQKYLQLIG